MPPSNSYSLCKYLKSIKLQFQYTYHKDMFHFKSLTLSSLHHSTLNLNMTSTVKAFLVAALLVGVTSAGLLKVAPGVDCWYKDRYCETTGVQSTTLIDKDVEDVEECYNLCAAEPTCNEFTVKTNGARPGQCYMLTEACVENKVDDCIAFGKCVSGPSDCAASSGDSNCPPLPALAPEFVIWQCTDANLATFNPYTDESSPGTICKQV